MQVNDLVKVSAPGHANEGEAGIVIASGNGENTVKLDLAETPIIVTDDELQFLGR